MSGSIRRREGVDDDIAELAEFFIPQSLDLAIRFVDAVERTLKDLAQSPGIGSFKSFSDESLVDIRTWWVRGFPKHLIYFIARPWGIEVLAVLHGSRDAERILTQRI